MFFHLILGVLQNHSWHRHCKICSVLTFLWAQLFCCCFYPSCSEAPPHPESRAVKPQEKGLAHLDCIALISKMGGNTTQLSLAPWGNSPNSLSISLEEQLKPEQEGNVVPEVSEINHI